MNVERMRAVAARIVDDEKHFDMARYFGAIVDGEWTSVPPHMAVDASTREFRCNTSGCFGGYAIAMFGTVEALQRSSRQGSYEQARSLLDLSAEQAEDLFAYAAPGKVFSGSDTTAQEVAAEALRMADEYEARHFDVSA